MLRLFVALAVAWIVPLVLLLVFAPHMVGAHWFQFLWVIAVLVALPFVWRWLARYKATASIAARLDAAEGKVWTRFLLHVDGAKSAILMGLASLFATAKDWASNLGHTLFGLAPSDLDPFKDSTLLHAFFSDAVALKAIAGIAFFAAILSIKGKLQAATIVPAPGTAAPVPSSAPAAPTT